MPRNQKKILALIIAAIALLIAVFLYFKSNQQAFEQDSNKKPFENMIPEVNTIVAAKKNIIITKELPARVNAYESSEVRPEISGLIKRITFREGSFVRSGKQLYQIESSVQKADIKQAEANLSAAKAKAERFNKLLNIEGISKQEYEEVLSEVALAKANLVTARLQINRTSVLAPISGVISRTNFTVGALVTENQETPLATITKLSPIYVDITQPSSEAIKNRNNNNNNKNIKVSLLIDGKEYNGSGILQFTQSFADQATDTVILRARFENKNEKLIPGIFVTAKLHLQEYEAITIPQSAVSRDQNGDLNVFVINDENIAIPRKIIANDLYNNDWIIKRGLEEGERIINNGLFKIKPNTKVTPI